MTLNGNGRSWKKWTGIALAVLLAVDLALASFLWQASREGPHAMRARRDRMAVEAKLLRADVDRGEKIRASLPQAGKDCDRFYHQAFLNASTGYSQIEADLGAIASKADVRTSGFSFKQKEVKDRGVTQIGISTNVEADYPAVIQFISGLERSRNFYLIDGLRLASATAGGIRLELELHTYFRM